jgi:hypothetical protein
VLDLDLEMLVLVSGIDCAKVLAHGLRVLPTHTTMVEESVALAKATCYLFGYQAMCPVDRSRLGGEGGLPCVALLLHSHIAQPLRTFLGDSPLTGKRHLLP